MSGLTKQEHQLYMKALALPEADRTNFLNDSKVAFESKNRVVDCLSALNQVDVGLAWFEPTVFGQGHFGPYHLIETLGQGGMGRVFLAEQREPIQRTVAIKIMDMIADQVDEDQFLRETQWLASLNHPYIAKLFQVNHLGDHPYFAMEYVPGKSITEFCRKRRQPLKTRLELFIKVCEAVQHAHDQGVIHRDLKPSNILVYEEQGQLIPKIIDFGIATLRQCQMRRSDGRLWGTPQWLAPELRRQMQDPSPSFKPKASLDIYALGLTLFRLITGLEYDGKALAWPSEAFKHQPPLVQKQLAKILGTTPGKLKRKLRFGLDAVLDKALAFNPEDRYASVTELADDLRLLLSRGFPNAEPQHRWEPMLRWWQGRKRQLILGSVWAGFTLLGCTMAYQLFHHRQQSSLMEAQAQHSRETLGAVISAMSPDVKIDATKSFPKLMARAELAMDQQSQDPTARQFAYLDLAEVYVDSGIYEGAERLLEKTGQYALDQDPELYFKYQLMKVYLHYSRGEFQQANRDLQVVEQFLADYDLDAIQQYEIQNLRKIVYAVMGDVVNAHHCERREAEVLASVRLTPQKQLVELKTLLYCNFGLGDLGTLQSSKDWVGVARENTTAMEQLGYLGFEVLWLLDSGNAHGALESALELKDQMQSAFGKAHPAFGESQYYAGVVKMALGHFDEAEKDLLGALQIQKTILGMNHPETWNTLVALGELAYAMGEYAFAEVHFHSALDFIAQTQGRLSPSAVSSHLGLLAVYQKSGETVKLEAEMGWLTRFLESLPQGVQTTLPTVETLVERSSPGRITSGARLCSR